MKAKKIHKKSKSIMMWVFFFILIAFVTYLVISEKEVEKDLALIAEAN